VRGHLRVEIAQTSERQALFLSRVVLIGRRTSFPTPDDSRLGDGEYASVLTARASNFRPRSSDKIAIFRSTCEAKIGTLFE